jgi:hypothetical protein
MVTPEMREKGAAVRTAAAAEKAKVLREIMLRHKANDEPKPKHTVAKQWLLAAGYARGLASVETQKLIEEVWGPGRSPRPPKEPKDDVTMMQVLFRIEMKLDKLLNLWK